MWRSDKVNGSTELAAELEADSVAAPLDDAEGEASLLFFPHAAKNVDKARTRVRITITFFFTQVDLPKDVCVLPLYCKSNLSCA
jgi:hypothetical protein